MRHAAFPLVVLGVLAVSAGAAAPQSRTGRAAVTPERIQELIGQLASGKFSDRERATAELDALGPTALPQLRQALKSADKEVARRAELLVRKLEDRQLTADLLAPKRVHLKLNDVTVSEAIAELARQSGYNVQLVANGVPVANQRITLDTGDTNFWNALGQLSARAGLVEVGDTVHYTKAGVGGTVGKKKGGKGGGINTTINPYATPSGVIQLTGGQPADHSLPTCFAGSVRIRLLRATALPSGEVEVVLEVNAEPRLEGFEKGAHPRLDRAVAERGQMLAALPPAPSPLPSDNATGKLNAGGGGVAINVVTTRVGSNPTVAGPHQVTLRLAPGTPAATTLKELSGQVSVRTTVDAGPAVAIDNILKAAGKSIKGLDGRVLHVRGVDQMTNGRIRLQLTLENAGGLGGMGNVNFNGNVVIQGNNIAIGGTSIGSPANAVPRLLDADGKSYTLIQHGSPSLTINGNQVLETMTLIYQAQPGQGPPDRLVLPGQRLYTFSVPFTFENVVVR
jgi:hypothetical protein